MYSSDGGALRRVTEAIDRLEADRVSTGTAELTARIAAVWSMVSEIDPELARLASGYGSPAEKLAAGRDGGPAEKLAAGRDGGPAAGEQGSREP